MAHTKFGHGTPHLVIQQVHSGTFHLCFTEWEMGSGSTGDSHKLTVPLTPDLTSHLDT